VTPEAAAREAKAREAAEAAAREAAAPSIDGKDDGTGEDPDLNWYDLDNPWSF
jgi:hypothetical protein